MEELFFTQLLVDGHSVSYQVIFDHEQYIFRAQEPGAPSSFSFRRGHDEWQGEDHLPAALRQQAIEALEKYLMRQH